MSVTDSFSLSIFFSGKPGPHQNSPTDEVSSVLFKSVITFV